MVCMHPYVSSALSLHPSNVQEVRSQGLVITRVEPRFDIRLTRFQVDGEGDGRHFVLYRSCLIESSDFQPGGLNVDGRESRALVAIE